MPRMTMFAAVFSAIAYLFVFALKLSDAQTALPSPGRAVGYVEADTPGKWIVLSSTLAPVAPRVLEGGKVCVFEAAAGQYAVIQIPPGDAQPVVVTLVLGGVAPVPVPPGPNPPGPDPPAPPGPPGPGPPPNPPQPAPIAAAGFRVLILHETAARLPESQEQILSSPEVAGYLLAKTARDSNGGASFRFWDDDYSEAQLGNAPDYLRAAYLTAKQARPDNTPWIVVSDGKTGESRELPATVADTLALLRKYGGAQ